MLKSSSNITEPILGRRSGVADGTSVGAMGVAVAVGGNQITVEVGAVVIVGVGVGKRGACAVGWQPLKNSNPKIGSRKFFIRN